MNVSKYLFIGFGLLDELTLAVISLGSIAVVLTTAGTVSALLKVIIVAGMLPGIMSATFLMLMINLSKKEREVVILRVLGTKKKDILFAFVEHACFLGLVGTIVGILGGFGISSLIEPQATMETALASLFACLSASLVGGAIAGRTVWEIKIAEVIRE